MLWQTLWALVFGFLVSACLRVMVGKDAMVRVLGGNRPKAVILATLFGAASSSCSYAATAAARSAFKKGAGFVPSLAFMFASTNLVFELGAVLWMLMGWRFVLAELVGAFLLIGFMWLIVTLTRPTRLIEQARTFGEENTESCHSETSCCHSHEGSHDNGSRSLVSKISSAFFMDVSMLWKEILIGFCIAGFLSVLVPSAWWQTLFLTHGDPNLRLIENAIVGPIISLLSFVCSVGNIPLASTLWNGGIGFAGVISFIYADLIIIPLIVVYGKYYGWKMAAYMTVMMYVSMVLAGISVDLLFGALGLKPVGPISETSMSMSSFSWNYTTWLDIAAIVVVIALYSWRQLSLPLAGGKRLLDMD